MGEEYSMTIKVARDKTKVDKEGHKRSLSGQSRLQIKKCPRCVYQVCNYTTPRFKPSNSAGSSSSCGCPSFVAVVMHLNYGRNGCDCDRDTDTLV